MAALVAASTAAVAVDDDTPAGLPPFATLNDHLLDKARTIGQRMRTIYFVRTVGGARAVDLLARALRDKDDSQLLRHELAYVPVMILQRTFGD